MSMNFLAVSNVTGPKILNSEISAQGETIMQAIVRLREKLGQGVEIRETRIARIEFLHGGFRTLSKVSGRTLRKYTSDKGSIISSMNIVTN